MLLTKGLIRVGIGIPNDAEFELAAVDDPYGFASSSELSLFRRPLPSTNLKFLSTVMWAAAARLLWKIGKAYSLGIPKNKVAHGMKRTLRESLSNMPVRVISF